MDYTGKRIKITDRNSEDFGRYGVALAQEDGIVIVEFDRYYWETHTQVVKPYEPCKPFKVEQIGPSDCK